MLRFFRVSIFFSIYYLPHFHFTLPFLGTDTNPRGWFGAEASVQVGIDRGNERRDPGARSSRPVQGGGPEAGATVRAADTQHRPEECAHVGL